MRASSFVVASVLVGNVVACSSPPEPRAVATNSNVVPPPQHFVATSAAPRFTDPDRRAKLASAFPKIDALLATEVSAQKLPGLAFGVIVDGELVYEKNLGTADLQTHSLVTADTVFRIGSVTKTFTSLALMRLRDEGKLSIDDPVVRYLPELASLQYPTRDSAPFTLRHILTHSSGLPAVGNFSYTQADHDVTEAEIFTDLPRIVMKFAPGTNYSYSNFGMGLLGTVISRASGVRYRDYISKEIFLPLGMRSTFWDARDVPPGRLATPYEPSAAGLKKAAFWRLGASESAGGMFTTLSDLSRYIAFELDAYPARDDVDAGIVRRSSVRESHQAARLIDLAIAMRSSPPDAQAKLEVTSSHVGLAWHGYDTCELEDVVFLDGAIDGYAASIHLMPRQGIGIVMLTNFREAQQDPIMRGALNLLQETGGFAHRMPALSPALSQAMNGVGALIEGFSEERYHALFSAQLRAAVSSKQIDDQVRAIHAAHGVCRDPHPTEIESLTSMRFVLPCERGSIRYDISLAADATILDATGKDSSESAAAIEKSSKCSISR